MPTSADLLVDTSVAVPLVVEDHQFHDEVFAAVADRTLGLSGHAAFETYSVLTRLPPPLRLTPRAAAQVLEANFAASVFLETAAARELLASLPLLDIAGGSVYDALVATAAKQHGARLATRDRRAIPIYRAVEVDLEIIGSPA
jgi:toxin FitB